MEIKSLKSINVLNIVKFAGAYLAFYIGSGFATGQETIQYFGSYGINSYYALLVGAIIYLYTAISFLTVGYDHQFESSLDIFAYYCETKISRYFFGGVSIVIMVLFSMAMIAGFGATVEQYFNVPQMVGSIILGVISLLIILLGLNKLVDVIGMIGPFLIVITIITAGSFFITHMGSLSQGMALSTTLDIPRIGNSWLYSGVFFGCNAVLFAAPFLPLAAKVLKNRDEVLIGGISGVILYICGCLVVILALHSDIANLSKINVPTLYMAQQLSTRLGALFFIVILLGIFTTAVPPLFSLSSTYYKEKTKQYNIFATIAVTCVTFGASLLPFVIVLNMVYTGMVYAGGLFIIQMLVKQFKEWVKKTIVTELNRN